jgi:hypothetical protein
MPSIRVALCARPWAFFPFFPRWSQQQNRMIQGKRADVDRRATCPRQFIRSLRVIREGPRKGHFARKGVKITRVRRGNPDRWVGQGGVDWVISLESVILRTFFIRSLSWERCSGDNDRFFRTVLLNHSALSGLSEYLPGLFLLSCFCLLIIGRRAKSIRLQMQSPTNQVLLSSSGSSGQRFALHETKCLQSMLRLFALRRLSLPFVFC